MGELQNATWLVFILLSPIFGQYLAPNSDRSVFVTHLAQYAAMGFLTSAFLLWFAFHVNKIYDLLTPQLPKDPRAVLNIFDHTSAIALRHLGAAQAAVQPPALLRWELTKLSTSEDTGQSLQETRLTESRIAYGSSSRILDADEEGIPRMNNIYRIPGRFREKGHRERLAATMAFNSGMRGRSGLWIRKSMGHKLKQSKTIRKTNLQHALFLRRPSWPRILRLDYSALLIVLGIRTFIYF